MADITGIAFDGLVLAFLGALAAILIVVARHMDSDDEWTDTDFDQFQQWGRRKW